MPDTSRYLKLMKLLKDKSLSLPEAVNGSGILQIIRTEDAAPVVHAASVLRNTDGQILDDIMDSLGRI